ncbi:MAG: AAA family ATPase [Cetobacterium sp.]
MLKKIRFKNLYSFRDEATFSMEATKIKEYDENNCFHLKKNKILKINSIHGFNNAGKSNIFMIIFYLKAMIMNGHMDSSIIKKLEPFKFLKNSKEILSEIEIEFFLNEILYRYLFKFKNQKIEYEALFKKEIKEIKIFERKNSIWKDIEFSNKYFKNESLKFIPEELKIEKNLILNVLGMFGEGNIFKDIRNYFENKVITINSKNENMGFRETHKYLEKKIENRNKIIEFMKNHCLGFENLIYSSEDEKITLEELKTNKMIPREVIESIEKNLKKNSSNLSITAKNVQISTLHNVYDEKYNIVDEEIVDFMKYSSEGTKTLYGILGGVFQVLEDGGVIFLDEVIGVLHSIIIEDIIKIFNLKESNPKNAQLIFSGHNPYIMSESDIRRDQVTIVKKDIYGNSYIKRLSEYKEIKTSNSFAKSYIKILKEFKKNYYNKSN